MRTPANYITDQDLIYAKEVLAEREHRIIASGSTEVKLAPASWKIEGRGDLSFTGWTPRGEFKVMGNWLPARLPEQIDHWNKERARGAAMVEEIMALRQSDEAEALDAIQFAMISSGWLTGGSGIESGFSASIAALAIAGMRALERGEPLYL